MPDITRTKTGQIVLSQQFAERLYADIDGAGFTAQGEFLTAYDRLQAVAAETHDEDLAAGCCDGSCGLSSCRNGIPLIKH